MNNLRIISLMILQFMFFYNVNAATLTFEESWFTDSWTENGISWSIRYGDIRAYTSHSGTYHGFFSRNGDYLEANHKLNISSIWVYFFDDGEDNTILRLKGYDEYNVLQYTANISHSGFGYENESLNFNNVNKLLVEYDGSAVSFYIDDMSYTDAGALPVELVSFTANQIDEAVHLNWTTESEINAIGFILDRKAATETDWQQIASYQTNSDLVCLNNQIGNMEYSLRDDNIEPNIKYSYRLSGVDVQGKVTILQEIDVTTTDIGYRADVNVPRRTELLPAYPNPFNPTMKIKYNLATESVVNLTVFNIFGQEVRRIITNKSQSIGVYETSWNSRNNDGAAVPSGTYFLVLKVGDVRQTKKVALIR